MSRGLGNEQVDSSTRTVKEIVKENVLTYYNLIFTVLAVLLIIVGQFKDLSFMSSSLPIRVSASARRSAPSRRWTS